MKKLLTTSANFHTVFTDGEKKEQISQVELNIIMTETIFHLYQDGKLGRKTETSECRFMASPDELRQMASFVLHVADEADKLAEKGGIA